MSHHAYLLVLILCATAALASVDTEHGCKVYLPDSEALPYTAEERMALVEELRERERIRVEEEEATIRKNILDVACTLSEVFIGKAKELVLDSIRDGRKMFPYPLPIATSALETLRENFSDAYHIHVETPAELEDLITNMEVTPSYTRHISPKKILYYDDDDDIPCFKHGVDDHTKFVCRIHDVPGHREAFDDPVVFFTLYWDCDETEFLRRRMDTWTRYDRYEYGKGGRFDDVEYSGWFGPYKRHEYIPYDGPPPPPHPKDL